MFNTTEQLRNITTLATSSDYSLAVYPLDVTVSVQLQVIHYEVLLPACNVYVPVILQSLI